MKKSFLNILIALFLFNLLNANLNLKSQKLLGSIEEEALEFEFFKPVRFNTNNNKYFKFKYEKNETLDVFVYIKRDGDEVRITDSNGNNVYNDKLLTEYSMENLFIFNITQPGVYILEFYKDQPLNPFAVDNEFTVILPGQIIDTIDLSQKTYYNYNSLYLRIWSFDNPSPFSFGYKPFKYIVKNLEKDIYVYFLYEPYSYYYYDDEMNKNPFEICQGNNCTRNISVYKFSKGNEYTINIYFYTFKDYYYNVYYYFPFVFFPINEDTIENIDKGFYKSDSPKIYNFELKERNYMKGLNLNTRNLIGTISEEKITQDNIEKLSSLKFNQIDEETYSFENIEAQYIIFITIPPNTINEYMDNSTRVVIADNVINNVYNESINIPPGNVSLIYLGKFKYYYSNLRSSEEPEHIKSYNVLRAYSSTEKNLQYVMSNKTEKFNFLIENSYKNPIFINKSNNEVTINIKSYYPKYAFFGVMTKELFQSYLSFFLRSSNDDNLSEDSEVPIDSKRFLPINARVRSDLLGFYEFFNFYLKDFEENVNVYINKLYGETEFYECDDNIDMNNLDILTTPITNCNNKKSIFNRLFSLKGRKIVSGYLSPNSYFDIYVEYNDDDNIIKIPSVSENTVNSASKYIKKGIQYKVDFNADHMVKIEPIINVEVKISNEDDSFTLNYDNPTAKINGKNYIVTTNIDTMIYFYGKLNSYIKQIRIDPNKKGNLKITGNYREDCYYCIDYGFEGYNPLNADCKNYIRKEYGIFAENLYEKIKKKLVKNEYLYFYYGHEKVNDIRVKIEYIEESINSPNNDYTFVVIPKGSESKSLIINNNVERQNIYFGVHFCKAQNNINIYTIEGNDDYKDEKKFSFESEDKYKYEYIYKYGLKFRFESTEDFIFNYYYEDKTDDDDYYDYDYDYDYDYGYDDYGYDDYDYGYDDYINNNDTKWSKRREEVKELEIQDINSNSNNNIISFSFNANYINSTTRYIIVISSEEGDNSLANFGNPCYIAKLATEKPSGVKVESLFNAGTEKIITTQIDITDILNQNNGKYIIGIISQELRFSKKLKFYTPKKFEHTLDTKEIQIGDNVDFSLSENKKNFDLKLNEKPPNNKILLLHYNLESESPLTVKITNPDNIRDSFNINNKEGYINFPYTKGGTYSFQFENYEVQNLRSSNNDINGKFSILTTDSPVDLNIDNPNIELNEMTINAGECPTLKFKINTLNKDFTKKIVISNYNFNNINQIVSIKKNNQDSKELKFNYYTFEKDSKYEITIKSHQTDQIYVFEKVKILDYSSVKAEKIFSTTRKFDDMNDKFYIINWKTTDKIVISKLNKNPTFLLANITESQSKNLVKELQNMEFQQLENSDNLEIIKPAKEDYSVLMIELNEVGTQVKIELSNNGNEESGDNPDNPSGGGNKDDDDDDDKKIYIIVICVLGGILLIIVLFLIIRCIQKRKEDNNFEQKAKDINNEKLLQDI